MRLDALAIGEEFRLYLGKDIYRVKKLVQKPYTFIVAVNPKGEDEYFHVDTAVTIVNRIGAMENGTKFVHNSRWHEIEHATLVRCVDCATRKEVWLHPETEVIT